jgi:hypothetical protein
MSRLERDLPCDPPPMLLEPPRPVTEVGEMQCPIKVVVVILGSVSMLP